MKLIDTDLFVGADTFSFETTMFQSELWKSVMIKGPWSPPVVPGCAVCSNYTINPIRDAFKKKNFIWKEKFLSGGEGVREKGQISLVKEQKK